ncbi:MAG TPA: hypothetical protein VMV34_00340 [Terriglobia bacterium]|nr:hypothetical protein [Terriglobia bacterium]
MGNKPILTFDTSAINRLVDDPECDILINGLVSGFSLRLTFTSINEVAQTSGGARREHLFGICKQLLTSGDCLLPVGELLRMLIQAFDRDTSTFEWSEVDVRLEEAVEAAVRSAVIGDDQSAAAREEAEPMKQLFKRMLDDTKPAFDKVFAANPSARPESVGELIGGLQRGGQFWKITRSLYDRIAGHSADGGAARNFWDRSAPFQCLMGALCAALYDRNVRLPNTPRSLKAGWADTFMAVYLPYCDQFVSADGGQLACYREVAQLYVPSLTVRSWCDLRGALCVS